MADDLIFWTIACIVVLAVVVGGNEWLKAHRTREILRATQRRK